MSKRKSSGEKAPEKETAELAEKAAAAEREAADRTALDEAAGDGSASGAEGDSPADDGGADDNGPAGAPGETPALEVKDNAGDHGSEGAPEDAIAAAAENETGVAVPPADEKPAVRSKAADTGGDGAGDGEPAQSPAGGDGQGNGGAPATGGADGGPDDMGGAAGEAEDARRHPLDHFSDKDLNLFGALCAASWAHWCHVGDESVLGNTPFCPALVGGGRGKITPAAYLVADFVRNNRDAKPETLVIELRRKGFRNTPDPATNFAFRAAWTILVQTLNTLDEATRLEGERLRARLAAERERKGPAPVPPHELAENPLKRHPLTQEGRLLAGRKT